MFVCPNQKRLKNLACLLRFAAPNAPAHWRQGRCLGSGAFGQVYLCYDEDTGRELAVKRVLTSPHNPTQEKVCWKKVSFGSDSRVFPFQEVRTLENEITLLRALHHERVVQYIGCQRDGDSLCIFIEYMPGVRSTDIRRGYGILPPYTPACPSNLVLGFGER